MRVHVMWGILEEIEQRIKQHETHTRLEKIRQSAVMEHIHKTGRNIDFDNREYYKR